MKSSVIIFVVCFICASAPADEVMQTALKAIGLEESDLGIVTPMIEDSDQFLITQQILANPQEVTDVIARLKGDGVDAALLWAMKWMGSNHEPVENIFEETASFEGWVKKMTDLRAESDASFDGFDEEDRHLLRTMHGLVDPGISMRESRKDTLIALGRRVPIGILLELARDVITLGNEIAERGVESKSGRFETSAGLIIVGTAGDDVYAEPAVLIIDPGGNDRYQNVAGVSSAELPISLCVDLGGDDVYVEQQGVGFMGIGAVVDLEGDDRYEGKGMGQGIVGVGIVDDRSGNDIYQADVGGQGFGLYGLGILCDRKGGDQYAGGHLLQGVAGPGGVGILLDVSGDDAYFAGQLYRDFREGGAYFQSMAQGFSRGVRPLVLGGVGVLVDGAGADVYDIDYFGQGAAFWGGVGVLYDRLGDDRYTARRYAQGAGVHMGVGALVDVLGNDHYDLWAVGQGCGHDLSIGVLHDLAGHDVYRASWLAQGVGSANGVGWLDDHKGSDRYVVEREDTQGYGVLSRDYGSIGLFIDRSGQDDYDGRGATGLIWRGGQYGIGIDWPLGVVVDKQ